MTYSISIFKNLDIEPLIAEKPLDKRDSSKLMIINREKKEIIHSIFNELHKYINEGDCIVLNQSKVFKAKLKVKKETGSITEFLLINRENKNSWNLLCRKTKPGDKFYLEENISALCLSKNEDGSFLFQFSKEIDEKYLEKYGNVPLPHYIEKKRKKKNIEINFEEDINRYQTIYAKETGSIAAPTAGFHFSNELIEKLKEKGVKIAYLTLHIGWGTFKPIRGEIDKHIMLPEYCYINEENAKLINETKAKGKKIFAVGTSSVRTLEKMSDENGKVFLGEKLADIFIYPPYKFKVPDSFITNFHVPDSPPLALTAAFCGIDLLYKAYKEAIENKYRFYSYGDSMLII